MGESLKSRLLAAGLDLTEDDFGHWASDLYVIAKPGVRDWLRDNYEFPANIKSFTGAGDWKGRPCLCVPFAYVRGE